MQQSSLHRSVCLSCQVFLVFLQFQVHFRGNHLQLRKGFHYLFLIVAITSVQKSHLIYGACPNSDKGCSCS